MLLQTSLEAKTPIKPKSLSQSSIYPIEKLFVMTTNDADNVVPPSRFIISKNITRSPTMYPMNGPAFVSDRIINIRPMEVGELNANENHWNNGQQNAIDSSHQPNKHDVVAEPSEQAKALLDRIPDLSYMLSTKLILPGRKIEA
jgi:hypothetical protein